MINCEIKLEGNNISKVKITGHADFADAGSDRVCAGASMLSYAIANKCLKINKDFKFEENKSKGMIFINDCKSEEINLLMETLVEGFEMLEKEYKKNVNVRRS